MEKACRIIINDILNGKISTRRELEVEKRQLCRDLKLSEKTNQNNVRRCNSCRNVPPAQMSSWKMFLLS